MSVAEAKVIERLDRLIKKGNAALATHKPNPPNVIGFPTLDAGAFSEWRAQCLTALRDVAGTNHTYAIEFDKAVEKGFQNSAKSGIGILQSLKEDIENGYLVEIRALVISEVFSDFLAMAKHLLDNGYIHPAASLCGAVLEDGLRRLAINGGVKINPKDDLSALNNKCAQAGLYNNLQRKQIAVWTDIRNSADHGKFSEYSNQDVSDMQKGVTGFLGSHLT